jgi:SSS family solute:Na+ symporter
MKSAAAHFTHHALPPEYATDKILPYFMSQVFPTGATSLVIAAILAASLSSVDSAINSYTSVVDLYNRFVFSRQTDRTGPRGHGSDRQRLRVLRLATVGLGLIGTVLAMNVSRIRTLLEIASKLINAFSGPLFGIYLLAMLSRRATGTAVLAGGLTGSFVSYYVAYHTSIGFLWPSAFGLAATVATALIVTAVMVAIGADASRSGAELTWYAVMRRPVPEVDTSR